MRKEESKWRLARLRLTGKQIEAAVPETSTAEKILQTVMLKRNSVLGLFEFCDGHTDAAICLAKCIQQVS